MNHKMSHTKNIVFLKIILDFFLVIDCHGLCSFQFPDLKKKSWDFHFQSYLQARYLGLFSWWKQLKMLGFTKSFKIAGWCLRAGRVGRNYPVTFWKDPRNESKAQRKLLSRECLLFFALELWFFPACRVQRKEDKVHGFP